MSSSKSFSPKLVIFMIVFVDLLGFGIMIPMLPFFGRALGASATEVGALMFVYSFMQFFLAPVWGSLSDRFGRRPILLITILGQSLAFLGGALATSFMELLISRVVAGVFAANISTAQAYMADVTSNEDRAKGMGLIGAAFGLGFILGPAIGGSLMLLSPSYPSGLASCICLFNFIFALFVLKESSSSVEQRQRHRRRFGLKQIEEILSNQKLFVPTTVFFLLTFAFVQLEITFGLYVTDRFQFSEREAGFLFAFLGVVMALIQGGLIGKLVKRFGEVYLVFTGLLFLMAGLSGIVFSWTLVPLLISLMILAIGNSLTNPCLTALVSRSASASDQGSVLGVFQSGASLARVLAPMVAGALYDVRLILPMVGGVVIVGLGALLWAWFIFTQSKDRV